MSDYPPRMFDTTVPQSARVWNYWLGGKDHFPIDREFADKVYEVFPEIIEIARASRAFLARAVCYLAGEMGIRQFLDIGTGLPTADNTHEVAQRVDPTCRVVYVDNDPLVLVHARALLVSTPEGATAYLDADVRNPEKILAGAAETLDFSQPVALMLLGVMGSVPDLDEAYSIVGRLRDAVPSGSYLVALDGTARHEPVRLVYESPGSSGYRHRTPRQIAGFFDGFELLEPGVVSAPLWRPEPDPASPPAALDVHCGVGRKP